MHRILSGALAGVVATVVMTMVISSGKLLGLLRTPPPTQITTTITNRAGIDPESPEPMFNAGTLLAHAGFGAVAGIIYTVVKPLLPRSSIVAGAVYGGAIWVTAYGGYLPALRLYPWPDDDRRSRTAVMIAAHALYGVTLAEMEKRLASGPDNLPRQNARVPTLRLFRWL